MSSKLPRRKIGLALSSGAAAGFAHIGVLEALGKEGIPIDMIAGTSAGAFIGALYAQGKDVSEIKSVIIELGRKRVSHTVRVLLDKMGLIRGKKKKFWLRETIGDVEFKDLRIPFACVATDIETGDEVVIKDGSVLRGVRASGSFPVIVPLCKRDGRYLVDGGLVNPVPVSVLKEMGAEFIIAVDAVTGNNRRVRSTGKKPGVLRVIKQMIHISRYQVIKTSLVGADVVIELKLPHVRFYDWHRAQEAILQGQQAAQGSIPEIKRQLEA